MLYYLIVVFIIFLDQLSKFVVVNYVKPQFSIPLLEDIFHLTYVENTGAAFSILSNKIPLLSIITTIFIIALIITLYKLISKGRGFRLLPLSLAFIIGGALGNLIDRIRLGFVVDFFDFRLINFAIFNIADCFIVIGSILLIILIILDEKSRPTD